MSDERALLGAICAHPDEDTPRLAYADWLDEHVGSMPAKQRESVRMRAELIRVQCELARLPPDEVDVDTATRRVELELRQEALLSDTARREAWAKPLHPPPSGHEEFVPDKGRFVRGFPGFAANPYTVTNGYLTVGEAIFDVSPVHHISCRNIQGESADKFLALRWLRRVRRLSISTHRDTSGWMGAPGASSWRESGDGTDVSATEKLFAAPGLANLEELELRNWEFGAPGAPVAGRALTALRKLNLWGGRVSGPEAFVRLGELLPSEVRLRDFTLSDCRFGAEELRALAALPQLECLERLTLGSRFGEVLGQTPPLEPEGVQAITSAPFWPHLRSFRDNMGRSGFTADAIHELVSAPPAPALRTLTLPGTNFRMAFVTLLCSPLLASVTALDLSGTRYGDFFASYVGLTPHLGQLLHLKVNNCEIASKGVKSLASASFAANLVRLELQRSLINKAAVNALVAPGAFPRLRWLDVSGSVNNTEQKERLRARFGDGVRL